MPPLELRESVEAFTISGPGFSVAISRAASAANPIAPQGLPREAALAALLPAPAMALKCTNTSALPSSGVMKP